MLQVETSFDTNDTDIGLMLSATTMHLRTMTVLSHKHFSIPQPHFCVKGKIGHNVCLPVVDSIAYDDSDTASKKVNVMLSSQQ